VPGDGLDWTGLDWTGLDWTGLEPGLPMFDNGSERLVDFICIYVD
jgi:hypothetical protein